MTNDTAGRDQTSVLIVDDQALLRSTMRDLLQEAFPDFDFLDVGDGASALSACDAYRPVLVLMDKCLPDVDGIELTAVLIERYPAMQVIVISYRSGEAYAQRAREVGACAFLCKDKLASELVPAVAAALRAAGQTAGGAS